MNLTAINSSAPAVTLDPGVKAAQADAGDPAEDFSALLEEGQAEMEGDAAPVATETGEAVEAPAPEAVIVDLTPYLPNVTIPETLDEMVVDLASEIEPVELDEVEEMPEPVEADAESETDEPDEPVEAVSETVSAELEAPVVVLAAAPGKSETSVDADEATVAAPTEAAARRTSSRVETAVKTEAKAPVVGEVEEVADEAAGEVELSDDASEPVETAGQEDAAPTQTERPAAPERSAEAAAPQAQATAAAAATHDTPAPAKTRREAAPEMKVASPESPAGDSAAVQQAASPKAAEQPAGVRASAAARPVAAATETTAEGQKLDAPAPVVAEAATVRGTSQPAVAGGAVRAVAETANAEPRQTVGIRADAAVQTMWKEAVATSAASTVESPRAPAPLNESHFVDSLMQQARLVSRPNGSAEMQIEVDPADLGPVKLRLMLRDDTLRAFVQVENQGVREAVEGLLPRIRQMFAAEGIELDKFDVDLRRAPSESAGQGGQEPGQRNGSASGRASGFSLGEEPPTGTRRGEYIQRRLDAAIDFFA